MDNERNCLGLPFPSLSTPTERKISGLEIEVESLTKQLEEEQRKCFAIGQERMDLRRELEAMERKNNGCTRPLLLAVGVFMFFICIKFFTTHRLSPDIGEDSGRVSGFHYEIATWWGLSKKTYNQVRFSKGEPEYWNGEIWRTIPAEAWGVIEQYEDATPGEYYK